MDIDKSGLISYTEFIASLIESKVNSNWNYLMDVFKRFDKNMDGKLSEKEFVEGSKNNPAIVGKLIQINRRKSSVKDIKGMIRVGQNVSD